MKTSTLLLSSFFAAVVACGGNTPEANAPAAPTAPSAPASAAPATSAAPSASAAPAASAAPSKAWDDMSREEKLQVMKTKVLPQMHEEFQKYDPKFAEFTCATCHGPGAKEGKFDMPNPGLPKLDFRDGGKEMRAKHPEAIKFMSEVVVPKMAAFVGEAPFDPATKKGFGCGECHTMVH